MTAQPELETDTGWLEDSMEMDPAMSDDEFDFDEIPGDDGPEAESEAEAEPSGSVPVWRLIEMSRENRFLKQELADFDSYDVFDNYGDDFGHEYSH